MRVGARPILVGAILAALAGPAAAARAGPPPPPPQGCAPVTLSAARTSSSQVCVHRLLVTQTTDSQEQNRTTFTVTDHTTTFTATVPNWWPSGGPAAGMVITMWGHASGGVFAVDRWIDLSHGTGPAPEGPYQEVSALAVSSGQIPEHRMVWIPTFVFLLDPQDTGDGDIHVQTANGCPGAGVTTETTPPLRGYVDHPALPGLVSASDTSDAAHNHLADAPPVGVPVMILGATRYDYGFGWWELHPIRAWRFLTLAETSALIAECGAHPVPELDQTGPVPAPFGFPPCTDGSEFGSPPGYGPCASPRCYVAHTAIGQPEQLAGPCTGIAPVVTPSQESTVGPGTSSSPPSPAPVPGNGGGQTGGRSGGPGRGGGRPATVGQKNSETLSSSGNAVRTPAMLAALARSYGALCAPLRPRARGFHRCLVAMARLAGGETSSVRTACRNESRRRSHHGGHRASDFERCVAVGRRLLKGLRGARITEG